MKLNGRSKNLFRTIRADPVAKMNQLTRFARHAPLHFSLSAEKLGIRTQTPKIYHPFIAQFLQMFEHQKSPHSADQQSRATLRAVKRSKGIFKRLPVDSLCQAMQRLAEVELTGEITQKKGSLSGIGAVRFHGIGLEGF